MYIAREARSTCYKEYPQRDFAILMAQVGSPQSLSFLTKTSIPVSLQSILQLWKDERASFVLRIEKERFNNMFNYIILAGTSSYHLYKCWFSIMEEKYIFVLR